MADPRDLYILEWATRDLEESFEIHAFGKTPEGASVVARITFCPYFFVATPGWSTQRQRLFIAECEKLRGANSHSMPVARRNAWGYTDKDGQFVQLAFDTLKDQKRCRSILAKSGMSTFEGNVDPVVRLCHVRNISPTGWVRLRNFSVDAENVTYANCDLELVGNFTGVSPLPDCEHTKPPVVVLCSWDIEVFSADGSFPTPDVPGNKIIQIASAFQMLGHPDPYRVVVVCLDETTDDVDGVEIVSVGTEAEVLAEWMRILHREKADVLLGWNTWGFDWKYVCGRAHILTDTLGSSLVDLGALGRGSEAAGEPRSWELNSGAYGQNSFFLLRAPGIVDLDLMQLVKREHKLESYSLNAVAGKFLGDAKLDLPASEIFRKFLGTPDDRADIARYAAQDVKLPLRLFSKMNMYDTLAQMSVATCVPIDYLLSRGQQIKVYSLILKQAREMGYVLPDDMSITIDGKFEGATVLDAKKGAHFDVVSGLDFASLYPSIIRAYNLCYTTMILPGSPPVPDDDVYTVETGLGTFSFAQSRPGIVPKLLENLAVWRKDAKKKMAACKASGDEFGARIWDGAQLAYKVSSNSVYGFLGASKGFLPCVPIAAAVTATGRQMIQKTKDLAESLVPGSEVVYGDSVAGYTPLLLRHDSKVWYDTFDSLSESLTWSRRQDGKEYAECEYLVWSDGGWTRLERLIRHAAPEHLVRVLTHTGVVDVTADHSLLLPDGTPVAPHEVGVGTRLMHHPLPDFTRGTGAALSEKEARVLGLLMGDDLEAKIVPHEVLASSYEVRKAFWDGVYDAGDTSAKPLLQFDQKSQISIASLIALGVSLGYTHVSLDTRASVYTARFGSSDDKRDPCAIKKIQPIEYDGEYVYDCTTANHHFAAGPGTLVVHNTDSVMVKFHVPEDERYDMRAHFKVAERVAKTISDTFPGCIELEFEKCYYPYLLFSKKRYAGLMFTSPDAPDYIDVKGLQLVRRDNAPVVRTVSQEILEAIMREKSTETALAACRKAVVDVITGHMPVDAFVVSKSLRGTYANPDSQPHVQVARKIKARTGERIPSGSRVPYVFVVDDNIDSKLVSAKAEDPGYVKEHGVEIDYVYYVENQLMSPIATLLELLVDDPVKAILEHPDVAPKLSELRARRTTLVRTTKRVKTNIKNRQREITSFFT